jgi:hypothetical protein
MVGQWLSTYGTQKNICFLLFCPALIFWSLHVSPPSTSVVVMRTWFCPHITEWLYMMCPGPCNTHFILSACHQP